MKNTFNIGILTLNEITNMINRNHKIVDSASYTYYDKKCRALDTLEEMDHAINILIKYKNMLDEDYINDLIKTF